MRKALLLVVLLTAGIAFAGIALNFSNQWSFPNCAAGGSSAQTVTPGQYLVTVTDSDVTLCFAATCAAGGKTFPMGSLFLLQVPLGASGAGQQMSCRSAASTGDIDLTEGR